MRSSDGFPRPRVAAQAIPSGIEDDLTSAALAAQRRTGGWLVERQDPAGFWCAELEGDSILQSEYILLLAWLGLEQSPRAKQCAQQLLRQQMSHGGWGMYPGAGLEISGSVKAYFALKLTGEDPESEPMRRAREAILAHGGADAVNSFTRFYLALLGQIPYELCPAVPPEMVLLPNWFPINIYRISAWSRTIFVPLSIVWAHRPQREVGAGQGIRELFLREPADWPELRSPGATAPPTLLSWERFFRVVDRGLKWCERRGVRPWRARAIQAARDWMLARFEQSDGLGAIFPPIIWSLIALKCLDYDDASPEVRECHAQLEGLVVDEGEAAHLQPCLSPVWDTAITTRALTAAGLDRSHASIQRAVDWLLDKEVRQPGDWSVHAKAEPGGWFFEHRNAFYPDVDDTIMVLMALRGQFDDSLVVQGRVPARQVGDYLQRTQKTIAACQRGLRWIFAMQNRDGGWGAFDKDNDLELLCKVPFADHNAMIDPSTPDITGRVLEMLGQYGHGQEDRAVERALAYLRGTQEADGSWYGRWGVNYIYGTWQVLAGLAAVRVPTDDPMMARGSQWLLDHQQSDGGWGESADSYEIESARGRGPTTASQTAWALLGLMAAGLKNHSATRRGIEYLVTQQQPDGSWRETEFTGTGFPRVFYLRYHYYPIYFPLLALAEWTNAEWTKGAL